MMRRVALATAGLLMTFVLPAAAQSTRQDGQVRIQTNINFFLAGPTNDGEEAGQLRDRARRIVYQMAGRECDLLRETLAKECRLEAVSNNINATQARTYGNPQQQPDGYSISGSLTMVITLK